MIIFWSCIAILFVILELMTLTFGFLFISIGAIMITLLLGLDFLAYSDFFNQSLIMLFFCVISFIFLFKSYKKVKKDEGFKENREAIAVGDLNPSGKVKWSGTILNAIVSPTSILQRITDGSNVIIKEFNGNVAIIESI